MGDGGKRELELCAATTAEPKPTEAKNALQVCKQPLDLVEVAPYLGELLGPEAFSAGESSREEVVPLAQERLRLGKRDVEHGRVRVRSYIIE